MLAHDCSKKNVFHANKWESVILVVDLRQIDCRDAICLRDDGGKLNTSNELNLLCISFSSLAARVRKDPFYYLKVLKQYLLQFR